MPKRIPDTKIIEALLTHDTQESAARSLGIAPQTIINRLKKASFTAKYHDVQNELLRATTRKLANASGKSAELLIDTMLNPEIELNTRLAVARDILRMVRDYVSMDELQRRLTQIEAINAEKEVKQVVIEEATVYRPFPLLD